MQFKAAFANGRDKAARQHGVHPGLFYAMFAVLLTGNALLGTAFLMSSDIARLLNGKTEQVIEAYEDRIAQLRVEVDRLHSRTYAQAGDINLQLQELSQQQEELLEQHQLVKVLVDKADDLGIEAASLVPAAAAEPGAQALVTTGNADIDETANSLRLMMGETRFAMTAIAETAAERTDNIVSELGSLGIAVDLPPDSGVGGPLLAPVESDAAAPMIEDANQVMAALIRYKAARDTIEKAPVHMPIAGNFRQSSAFGNRTDPFSGGRAFHAGLDFAAPKGTTVLSAGSGVVSFVGQKSGYGNVVEVTHGNGLVTRYGHLSAFLSEEGQRVNTGTPIARVGSTGRSTGPHLHFEVRKADAAIDPKNFIDAGKRLLAVLS